MRKTLSSLLLFLFLLPALLLAQQEQTSQRKPLVFTHVTVIDATGAPAKPDMTVVITDERITALGRTGEIRVPQEAQVIDASGKFLIPGLWDMHVHTLRKGRPEVFFPLFIANGITSVRDMGSVLEDFAQLQDFRQQIATGTLIGPRIEAATGPFLDGPHAFWPALAMTVANEAEARRAVELLKQHHVDFIKPYNNLPREVYFAILDEAKKQGLPVAGHVPLTISVAEASDAGQKTVEHLGSIYGGILLTCASQEAEIRQRIVAAIEQPNSTAVSQLAVQRAELPAMLDTYSSEKAATLFQHFINNGTWQVPTLTALRAFAYLDDPQFTNDERIKYLSPALTGAWQPQNTPAFRERTAADIANGKKLFQKQLEIVGTMHQAGVPLMAGTDVPNPYVFPGFSLHDELGPLVKAGLTPMAALQTATRNPAQFLNMLDSLGTVEQGKVADLVLLEANPLEDISNTQRIAAVIVRGKYVPKSKLQEMLADAEAAAKKK